MMNRNAAIEIVAVDRLAAGDAEANQTPGLLGLLLLRLNHLRSTAAQPPARRCWLCPFSNSCTYLVRAITPSWCLTHPLGV